MFMNECIDSTMDHIHVCFVVLLPSDDPRTSWSFQGLLDLVSSRTPRNSGYGDKHAVCVTCYFCYIFSLGPSVSSGNTGSVRICRSVMRTLCT
jgi:hypothetical protein